MANRFGRPSGQGRLGRLGSFEGHARLLQTDGEPRVCCSQFVNWFALRLIRARKSGARITSRTSAVTTPEWGFAESALPDGERVVVTPGGNQGAMAAPEQRRPAP